MSAYFPTSAEPSYININDWKKEEKAVIGLTSDSLFYEPKAGFIYTLMSRDASALIVVYTVAMIDPEGLVRPLLPGSTYWLENHCRGFILDEPIRFTQLIWKSFYDENLILLMKNATQAKIKLHNRVSELKLAIKVLDSIIEEKETEIRSLQIRLNDCQSVTKDFNLF